MSGVTSTDAEVDALVNAANSTLVMGAGVAGALKRKGGVIIEEEALRQGPIEVGEAVITTGGNLICYARHPRRRHGPRSENHHRHHHRRPPRRSSSWPTSIACRPVALPACGTGVGPHRRSPISAEAMLATVVEHLKAGKSTLKRVALRAVSGRRLQGLHGHAEAPRRFVGLPGEARAERRVAQGLGQLLVAEGLLSPRAPPSRPSPSSSERGETLTASFSSSPSSTRMR